MISGTDHPYLYPWFRSVPDREAYLFEYGGQLVRITGKDAVPLLSALLPFLDGRCAVAEIQQSLAGWDASAIVQALSVLLSNGLITLTAAPRSAGEDEHLLTALGGDSGGGPAVQDTRIGVAGTGLLAHTASTLCRKSGVGHASLVAWADEVPGALDLIVTAPSGDELPHLDAWNRAMLAREQPWLLLLPFDGVYGAVGPLFLPGETACYACFRTRRRSVLEEPWVAEGYDERPVYHPTGAAVTAVMAGLAIHLGLRWVTRRDAWIPGILYAVGLAGHPHVSAHEVFPVPRCMACRPRVQHTPAPWHAADDPALGSGR